MRNSILAHLRGLVHNPHKRRGEGCVFGRRETVTVTSRAELEAALRKADRIVVEGDPALADLVLARVGAAPPPPGPTQLRPLSAADREAHVPIGRGKLRLWPWVLGAVLLAMAAAAAFVIERIRFRMVTAPGVAPPRPDLTRLAWPAVAIVAVLALFFVVRQAIANNRDVDVSWQVTERVQGRLVIARAK